MSAGRFRLDPRGLGFAIGFALLAACGNAVWILLDSATPSWDQSHYMTVAMTYRNAFDAGGIPDVLHAIRTTDPSRGPLFPVLLWPLISILGPGPRSGLLVDVLLSPLLYIATGQVAWLLFRNWIARLLAIGIVAMLPLMVVLGHQILQDYLLVTLTVVSLWLLLLSDGFRRWDMTVAMGVAMGLGTLTKVTFPAFVAGPLIVVLVGIAISRRRADEGEPAPSLGLLAPNVGSALLAYAIVIAPWYATNFDATVDYVRSTTSGPLSEGAGPENPLTFEAIVNFALVVVNQHVTWYVVLAGLVAAVLCGGRVKSLFMRPLDRRPLLVVAFLLAWFLVPFVSVATGQNQDVRLMAPAMPALAVLVGGAIAAVERRRARLALIAVTGVLLAYQTAAHTIEIHPPVPDRYDMRIGPYEALVILDSDPIGYQRLPGSDYGTPVIEYMAAVADRESHEATPPMACLLQSEPIVNVNTFIYLAAAEEAEFTFSEVVVGPGELRQLPKRLAECDQALYVPQTPVSAGRADTRLAIVNSEFAARYMTPRLLAMFDGPSRTFRLGEPIERAGSDPYLTTSGSGAKVRVLTRRPDR